MGFTLEPAEKFTLGATHKIGWEASRGVVDTNLYRSAANTLKTDDSLVVGTNLTVDTNTLYVDATNNRVGVGTATPTTVFDLLSPNFCVGSDSASAATRTANTNKLGVVGVPHYATSNGGWKKNLSLRY